MRSYRANVCRSTPGLERPDVVIGSCVHPYAVDAARRLAGRYGARFVYEIRDIWPESLLDVGGLTRWNPIYWDFRRIELRAFRSADGVIVLFPGMDAYVGAHGVHRDRVCYLPNGIDPELYGPVQDPPDSMPFVLSYFGAQGPPNGLRTAIEAAARLPSESHNDVLIRLVGDGAQKKSLMELAATMRLRNVEFRDPVPKPELTPLAKASHAFLYCHAPMPVVERCGVSANKLFDYLMHARPILFSCRSYNNPVKEAQAGVSVPPGDPEALARAVMQIRNMSPEQRKQMGRNGRRYALKHHDLSQLAGRLEQFLDGLVNGTTSSLARRKRRAA